MSTRYLYTFLMGLFLFLPVLVNADILVDGRVEDWEIAPTYTDPTGDGLDGGIDFTDVYVTQQYGWLLIRIDMNNDILLQDGSNVAIYIDTDNNSETGLSSNGIGAELVWRFGDRNGTFYPPDSESIPFEQGELGIISAPTITSDEFEIAIDLSARIDDTPVFGFDEIRYSIKHTDTNGDFIPDSGGLLFELEDDTDQPVELPVEKQYNEAVRFVTWNVLNDGIVEHTDEFSRILQAIQPDMVMFEEAWNTTAFEIAQSMNEWLPLESGSWTASKQEGDIVLASRWQILNSWDIPDARATAYLAQTPDTFDDPFFVIGAHPPSGNNDEGRQYEIDAIMAFLRDAMTQGGDIDIQEDIPIILSGDLNLVGYSEQLTTLLEGEIVNQDEFGPSFDPDWDGTGMLDLFPRHPAQMFVYTWRDATSSWTPGKLDYIILSDSNIRTVQSFVLDSKNLSDGMREELGLEITDSEAASDHIPVVADLVPLNWNTAEEVDDSASLPGPQWVISPNPFNPSLTVTVDLEKGGFLEVGVYDILGREVKELSRNQVSAGRHQFYWDATESVRSTASGTYFIRLVYNKSFTECRKAILLK